MSRLVIVTGGSGFIGINLITRLLKLGYKVVNLDIKKPRKKSQEKNHLYIDITNFEKLNCIIENYKPDYLIHLAARTDLKSNNISEYKVNTVSVKNICVALSNNKIIKKILFASTMLVCKAGHIPLTDSEYSATTAYGLSKVEAEKIVKKYSKDLPSHYIFRPTSIWGPWFQKPYRDFFDLLLSGKYFKIGPLSSTKTFGYVENSVNQIISLMESEIKINEGLPIYIGDNIPLNLDEWADQIASIANCRKPFKIPFFILRIGAIIGDFLSLLRIKFPLSSFRLKNMTTNNIIPNLPNKQLKKYPVIDVNTGIKATLKWIKNEDI